MEIKQRTVNTKQVITDYAKLYNPNNPHISLREGGTNPMSHGKAKNIWLTFDETTQKGQYIDDGKGMESRKCLVEDVGTPRAKDPTAFDMQDKGLQAFQQLTNEICFITKSSSDEFKQLIRFPDIVVEYSPNEPVPNYEWEPNPQQKTFTILRWINTKRKLTFEESKDFLRKTFEHAIRLGRIVFHIRKDFTSDYELLEAWDYGKADTFKIIKEVSINLSGRNWNLTGIAYQREINPDSHTRNGEYWLSTKGILPDVLEPTFYSPRMDIVLSANCDEIRDALADSLGKEKYNRGHAIYERILDALSKFIAKNFPKQKVKMEEIETKRQDDLNKAFQEAWKEKEGTEKGIIDPPKEPIICAKCGKEIWAYPCKYCKHDPNEKHSFHLRCLDCKFEWDTPKMKEPCPKCGSEHIELVRKSKYNAGTPKIVFDDVPEIINVRLGNPSLEVVIGKKHKYYMETISKPQGVFNTAYTQGFLYETMAVCKKWDYYMTPQGQQDLRSKIAIWNDKAIKGLKMLNVILKP